MSSINDLEIKKQNLKNLNAELKAKINQAKYSHHKLKLSLDQNHKKDIDFLSSEINNLNNKIIDNNTKIEELSSMLDDLIPKQNGIEYNISINNIKKNQKEVNHKPVLIKISYGILILLTLFTFKYFDIFDGEIIYTGPKLNDKYAESRKMWDEIDKRREAESFEFHKINQKLRELIDDEKKKSDYFHAHDGPLYFKELSSNINKSIDQKQTVKEDNDGPLSTPGVFEITK